MHFSLLDKTSFSPMTLTYFTLLLILGIALLAAAALLTFKPKLPAALFAYCGMLSLHFGGHIYLTSNALATWSIATLIVAWLFMMQPKGEPKSSLLSNIYVGLGSLAGLLVGLAIDPRFMLLCLCLGAIFGFAAYCKTPAGRWLKFPTLTFIQYFCNKCLPIVITFAMIGISIEGFLVK